MARAIIVGGGAFDPAHMPEKHPGDLLIGADSGCAHLSAMSLTPDVAVGDWDSLGRVPDCGEAVTLPVAKDETDLAAAARIARTRGHTDLLFLGALGGRRFSHSLAAVQLMAGLAADGISCELRDPDCTVWPLCNASRDFPAGTRGSLSVFALTEEAVVTLEGLWYSASHLPLQSAFPLGVSNAFVGSPARVTAERGVILIVHEPDAH